MDVLVEIWNYENRYNVGVIINVYSRVNRMGTTRNINRLGSIKWQIVNK